MLRAKNQVLGEEPPSPAEHDESSGAQPNPESESFAIPSPDKTIQCLRYKPSASSPELIFTHGAGGTLNAPAMINFAHGFAATKPLLYFEGSMNVKSRTKMFHAIIEHQSWGQVLGGRSMGARAAVMAAHDDDNVKALVLVSYPLQNGKGDVRDQILLDLREDVEVLFISGDRDTMCDFQQLDEVRRKMKAKSWLAVAQGADHGMNMKPKKATEVIGRLTGELAAKWKDERDVTGTECIIGWDNERGTTFQSSWSLGQKDGSGTAGNDDGESKADVKMKKVKPKNATKKANGGRKVAADQKEEKEVITNRKRGSKAKTATEPSAMRETRAKRHKSS